jgi:hypothetical protein
VTRRDGEAAEASTQSLGLARRLTPCAGPINGVDWLAGLSCELTS